MFFYVRNYQMLIIISVGPKITQINEQSFYKNFDEAELKFLWVNLTWVNSLLKMRKNSDHGLFETH